MTSVFNTLSCFLTCSFWEVASCHVVSYSMEKPMWQKKQYLFPKADDRARKVPIPVKPWDNCYLGQHLNCSLVRNPEPRHPVTLSQNSRLNILKFSCFRASNFRVICQKQQITNANAYYVTCTFHSLNILRRISRKKIKLKINWP